MRVDNVLKAKRLLERVNLKDADKEIRMAILKNFVAFSKVEKEAQENIDTLRKKMFGDRQEEAEKVNALRNSYQSAKTDEEKLKVLSELKEYDDFFKAENEFSQLVQEETEKDIECEVKKVDMEKFIDCLADTGTDFNASDLAGLDFIFN